MLAPPRARRRLALSPGGRPPRRGRRGIREPARFPRAERGVVRGARRAHPRAARHLHRAGDDRRLRRAHRLRRPLAPAGDLRGGRDDLPLNATCIIAWRAGGGIFSGAGAAPLLTTGIMFLSLLVVTFAIALLVSFVVATLFSASIRRILERIVSPDLAGAWHRYLVFALYVVGVSG